MPGCATGCATFSRDSIEDAWLDIRYHFGPRNIDTSSDQYAEDISEWNQWVAQVNSELGLGIDPVTSVDRFGKWLNWKFSIGTPNFGNLPTRIRDHVGISCIPCPYDLEVRSSAVRSEMWTSLSGIPRNDHEEGQIHYLQVAQRGNTWGFECTYSGCTYEIDHGHPYFHA
jgi:hypothetical protein